MKIHSNIPKLQQGGAALPFVSWTPVPDTPYSAAAASTTAAKEKKEALKVEDVIPKEMIEALKQKGLPSDMSVFTESIMSLFNDPVYKMTGQLNPATLSTRYLSIVNKMNNIAFNKELYDKSIDRLQNNGGLYDIAISNTGRMVVQDLETGQIKQVSPDEYYEKLGSYKAISNGDLAHIRAYNPSMAFSSDVFSVLNNGIGQETLQKYIKEFISDLKSSDSKIQGYIEVNKDKILNGFSQLVNNNTVAAAIVQDGVYKLTHEEKSNAEQAKNALEALYSNMPMTLKHYLRAKAAEQGINPDEAAEKILVPFINSRIETSRTIAFDFDKQATDASGSGGSDKSTITVSQARELLDGFITPNSDTVRMYSINTGGGIELSSPASRLPALKTIDGKIVGAQSMDKVLQDSTLSTGYKNNMYFGGKKVDSEELHRIVFDGGEVVAAYLPVKADTGELDLESLKKITKINRSITSSTTEEELKEMYRNEEILPYYYLRTDPEALAKQGLVKPFYMVNAKAATTEGVDFGENNPYIKLSDNEDRDKVFMNRILQGEDMKGENKVDDSHWFLRSRNDKIYNGTFFIQAPDIRTAESYLSQLYMPKNMNYAVNIDRDASKRLNTSGWGSYGTN